MSRTSAFDRTFIMQDHLLRLWLWSRKNGFAVGREVFVNLALPYLVYRIAGPSLGVVYALMSAAAPPLVWAIVEFTRHRRTDALSILTLTGIALSLLAFLGGGGVRFLQLREQLVIAAIGVAFLVSAAIGKPLIFLLARARIKRRSPADAQSFAARRDNADFRRAMMIMTLAWGICLIAEAALSGALIFVLTIERYLIVGPLLGYATIAAMTAWTFWYAKRAIVRSGGRR